MASNQVLCKVREIPSNNSFIRLSRSHIAQVCLIIGEVPVVCIVREGHDDIYFSIEGFVPDGEHPTVEVGSGRGLEQGLSVLVQRPREADISLATSVVVTPASENDWNILELNQNAAENAILEQIRVVQEGRLILLQVKNLPLWLKVKSVKPSTNAVVLQKMTELVIDPSNILDKSKILTNNIQAYRKDHKSAMHTQTVLIDKIANNDARLFNTMLGAFGPVKTWFDTGKVEIVSCLKGKFIEDFLDEPLHYSLRVFQCSDIKAPYTCTVSKSTFPDCSKRSFIAKITPITFPNAVAEKKPGMRKATESIKNFAVYVKVNILDDLNLAKGGIYLSETCMRWKGIEISSRVFVQSVEFNEKYLNCKLRELTLMKGSNVNLKPNNQVLRDMFNNESTIVPRDSPIIIGPGAGNKTELLLMPSFVNTLEFIWISKDVRISLKDSKLPCTSLKLQTNQVSDHYVKNPTRICPDLFSKEICGCMDYIRKCLNLEECIISNRPSHILVTGSTGTGKTSFLCQISSHLGTSKCAVFSKIINCKTLKGKRGDVIKNQIEITVEEAKLRRPSLVLLDDFESLVPVFDEERPELHNNSLAKWFRRLLLGLSYKSGGVMVIASASSESSLHPDIRPERGSLPFKKVVELPQLGPEQRKILLDHLLAVADIETPINVITLSDGFAIKDIEAVVHRLVTSDDQPTSGNLVAEIEKYTPLSRWGQRLKPFVSRNLDSVGALHEARQTLIQTLLWPSKYPKVFSKCGVRIPRGMLLYGAPGTGKTLLAEAIASFSGLNFITVKGPELLSKYIGASEAAVRETFQRAESCRPCIIFFDEFDSLAPRRGHDSTGVTDRVVNQLLTKLDGVEGLEGVWIMAASSRPDLIDPALLRPGRIDKIILCPMPNETDRQEILAILSKTLNMSEDVNLDKIAEMTPGLTGADLSALLFTAQLAAFENSTNLETFQRPFSNKEAVAKKPRHSSKNEYQLVSEKQSINTMNYKEVDEEVKKKTTNHKVIAVTIEQRHLKEAARNTKPSVGESQLVKYNQIYSRFVLAGFPKEDKNIKQRATLA